MKQGCFYYTVNNAENICTENSLSGFGRKSVLYRKLQYFCCIPTLGYRIRTYGIYDEYAKQNNYELRITNYALV